MNVGSALANATGVMGRHGPRRPDHGFSVIEMLTVVSVSAVLLAVAVPTILNTVDGYRLGIAAREVERELQTARLRAVSANKPMRVRFNCPATGQYRLIEITGVTTTDTATNRCDPTAFPSPGPRDTDRATPELDGPVRRLHPSVTVSGADLQFFPNGTVHQVNGTQLQAITTEVAVTLTRASKTATVSVNGLGKIRLQ